MVEAEEPVRVAGRGGAVVQATEGKSVELGAYIKRCQGRPNSIQIEIPQFDSFGIKRTGFVLRDQLHAHSLDVFEIIVEGRGRLFGRERTSAHAQMVFERPVAGPAPGDDARKEDRVTAFRGPPDAACGNLRGGGHDQLKRILDRLIGVEEQDVLRARAYVDR